MRGQRVGETLDPVNFAHQKDNECHP